MQTYTIGYAPVVGEWSKKVATDYCKQLVDKGLVAEVVKSHEYDNKIAAFDFILKHFLSP